MCAIDVSSLCVNIYLKLRRPTPFDMDRFRVLDALGGLCKLQ